ncbi:MAG: Nucleoside diphosphate kinase [Microgenomates group bacterium GW2011_GWB1_45_17]|nr:MAG: Nucleoside diphosphate kinase [Microgenomates group bacterium GW2011_GWB1_45_17]
MKCELEGGSERELALTGLKLEQALGFVAESVDRLGLKAILKGGAVRDMVWNHVNGTEFKPKDLDIFVFGNIHLLHGDLQKKGAITIDRKPRKGSAVFKYRLPELPEVEVEVGSMIAEPLSYDGRASYSEMLRLDAFSSDLRVNSMSLPISGGKTKWNIGEVNDPLDGKRDVKERSLRVSNEDDVFPADRILSAVRLSVQLDADLPDSTLAKLARSSNKISGVPYHRIRPDAEKIVKSQKYDQAAEILHGLGVIDSLFQGRIMAAGELFKRWFGGDTPDFTVIMLKPDGFEKQLQVKMIKELREMGLDLAARRRLVLTPAKVSEIYPDIRNDWLIPRIVSHLISGQCEALLLLGQGALPKAREYIGQTTLGDRQPTGIRGKFADDFIRNIAHSPDCMIDLERTTKVLFPELALPARP